MGCLNWVGPGRSVGRFFAWSGAAAGGFLAVVLPAGVQFSAAAIIALVLIDHRSGGTGDGGSSLDGGGRGCSRTRRSYASHHRYRF